MKSILVRLTVFFLCAFILSSFAQAQETLDDLVEAIDNPEGELIEPEENILETPPSFEEQLKDIPDEYLAEAENFKNQCREMAHMRQHYDCRCLAVKYLDKRIEVGPDVKGGIIAFEIAGECQDATEAAGIQYQRCMSSPTLMPQNVDLEAYCTCLGNTYARLYERYAKRPSSKVYVNIQAQAINMCRTSVQSNAPQ